MLTLLTEDEFRKHSDHALSHLKKALYAAEDEGDFEVEEQNGVLNIVFERPSGKFVVTPNTPVRQIWISALSTSFKLDWDEVEYDFVYPRTREGLTVLVGRLIAEHTGDEDFELV
jgi:CyaY protein